jgi:hypothetical protein
VEGLPLDALRLLEHLHGHLGWLVAAVLVHPAIVLRRPKRRAHLAVALSVALVTLVASLGVYLYVPYREKLRQQIFLHAPRIGLLFERKEHMAFAAFALAWAGALSYLAATRVKDERTFAALRKAAHWSFVAAAALAIVVATLGTIVATYKSF